MKPRVAYLTGITMTGIENVVVSKNFFYKVMPLYSIGLS